MNVLVTGGSGGIGEAVCRKFFKEGHKVIIGYCQSEEKARTLAKEINGFAVKADVKNQDEVREMFGFAHNVCGKIDILINNAGVALKQGLFFDVTEEEFDKVFTINVKGTFNCCKYAVHDMLQSGKGSIINVSSIWGIYGGSCEAVYSASKGAINAFTLALSQELESASITVNAVAPGMVDTAMNSHLTKDEIEEFVRSTERGRMITPEEVAEKVYSLALSGKTGIIEEV